MCGREVELKFQQLLGAKGSRITPASLTAELVLDGMTDLSFAGGLAAGWREQPFGRGVSGLQKALEAVRDGEKRPGDRAAIAGVVDHGAIGAHAFAIMRVNKALAEANSQLSEGDVVVFDNADPVAARNGGWVVGDEAITAWMQRVTAGSNAVIRGIEFDENLDAVVDFAERPSIGLAGMIGAPPEVPSFRDGVDRAKWSGASEVLVRRVLDRAGLAHMSDLLASGDIDDAREKALRNRRMWPGCSDVEKQALIALHPDVIGEAEGIPWQVRDEVNRAELTRLKAWALRTGRDDLYAELAAIDAAVGEITGQSAGLRGRPQFSVLSIPRPFDPRTRGRLVVGHGAELANQLIGVAGTGSGWFVEGRPPKSARPPRVSPVGARTRGTPRICCPTWPRPELTLRQSRSIPTARRCRGRCGGMSSAR